MQSLHGLHSVILLDQSDRWRNGDKPLVESYLHLVPELGSDKRRLMDVIYQEILLRGAAGEPSSYDEYARRFPELADELRLQFEVHGGLDWEAIDEELPNKEPPSIDAYRIEGELGRGTFGTVYKAWDQKLRRYVAIKLMPDVRSNDSFDEGEPFREAQSIARLTHPNIVQVHAVGTCESGVYFAQELVEGGTLADFIRSRTQPPKEAAEFTALLADAIHYAHINQVLHCDLKPPNVLLRTQPELGTSRAARLVDFQPKLADFGLARQLDTETMVENHHLTGTLQYMAPEQTGVEGAIVGIGADIYALGAVLYELLTGRPPFNDASKLKVFLQVRSEAPIPPRQLSSAIPIDIEAICLKCLNKDPALRYETAAALAEDLRRYVGGYTPLAVKASTIGAGMRWLNREPVVATLLGALVLTAMLGFAMVTQKMFVAQRAEKSERARADELEASLYRNQFRLAWSAFEDANIDQAKKLLKKTSPKHRSFEWYYLHS